MATSKIQFKLKRAWKRHVLPFVSNGAMMPDFLILGAQKSGSSSIYEYIVQHPQIIPPRKKEAHYFDVFYHRGLRWYRSQFLPIAEREARLRQSGRRLLTFDDTPDYIFHPQCALRAASLVPNARLILLVRDPVTRAFSHYWHEVRQGHEKLSFDEAIERETERLAGEYERIETNPLEYRHNFMHCSYLERGKYADQLDRWMKFFPREHLLVLKAESFFKNPVAGMRRVFELLQLDPEPADKIHYEAHHVGGYKEKLDPAVHRRLMERMVPHNIRLREKYGQEFDWDLALDRRKN